MTTLTRTRIFFPLVKVDVEQRLVYGRITSETVDKSGEIFDYDSSKPFFEKWSQAISKVTDGKSLGNVRSMHQPIAAGKLVDLIFDDVAKTIDCCAKIVDEGEWQKVLEGVYTGFSMGGNYVKRWADAVIKGVRRFTADPIEVSIVDNPCVNDATFSSITKAGGMETVAFQTWQPTNDEVVAEARNMGKAAGVEDFADYIEPAREALIKAHADTVLEETPADVEAIETALAEKAAIEGEEAPAEGAPASEEPPVEGGDETPAGEPETPAEPDPAAGAEKAAEPLPALKQVQLWETPDGKTFAKKSDAKKHRDALEVLAGSASPLAAAIAKATAAAAGPSEETSAEPVDLAILGEQAETIGKACEQLVVVGEPKLEKSMWNVSRLAEVLGSLHGVCVSATWDGEEGNRPESTVPQQIADGIATLGGALVEYAREEVAEMIGRLNDRGLDVYEIVAVEYVELAATATAIKADTALVEKVGARNSKKDAAKIQSTHDHMIELGAKCSAEKVAGTEGEGTVEKSAPVLALEEENRILKAQMTEGVAAIEGFAKTMEAMREEIDTLKKTPAPMPSIESSGGKVVTKGADNTPEGTLATATAADEVLTGLIKTLGADKVRDILFSDALSKPITVQG